MERIKHIKETQRKDLLEAQKDTDETSPVHEKIVQADVYDKSMEILTEQRRVREYIDSFDEQVLKDIFLEHFRRSGADETTVNWIPFDDVRIIPKIISDFSGSDSSYGGYSKKYGVKLYSHTLQSDQEGTLWTLIHEECHAVSTNTIQTQPIVTKSGHEIGVKLTSPSGVAKNRLEYLHTVSDREYVSKIYGDINEGITELITERIFREYKKRTGTAEYKEDPIDPERKISSVEETTAKNKFSAYERYWQTAKIYISLISAISDIPEDITENALIRMYIRNGAILSDELKMEFGSSCGAGVDVDIMNMLTMMNGENNSTLGKQLDSIISNYYEYDEDYNVIPNEEFQKIRQKIHSAYQKVKNEWGEAYKLAPL